MTDEQPSDGVVFLEYRGVHAAFLGAHLVGIVRPFPASWNSYIGGDRGITWRAARDLEDGKAALRRHIGDWYEALHQPLGTGQGKTQIGAALARVAGVV